MLLPEAHQNSRHCFGSFGVKARYPGAVYVERDAHASMPQALADYFRVNIRLQEQDVDGFGGTGKRNIVLAAQPNDCELVFEAPAEPVKFRDVECFHLACRNRGEKVGNSLAF
jgi:hypothetical protein